MWFQKLIYAVVALLGYIAYVYFEKTWILGVTGIALFEYIKLVIFDLSYDATLAAIKHYEDTTADIEEHSSELEQQGGTLDSETFRRRIEGMDDFS